MKDYSIAMLGPSGSGKTVFLSSLYKKLSTQGDLGFFLQVDTPEKRKRLKNIYTTVAVEEDWPMGTTMAEVSEWTFSCRVQNPADLTVHEACRFTYLDYAGGRLTDEIEDEEGVGDLDDFDAKLKGADAFLGLLDGQRLISWMKNERLGTVWAFRDLSNMIGVIQESGSSAPVHFLISKWDIVEQDYTLEQIRNKLLEIDELRDLVKLRNQANSPVRLIPVSAVGSGFATLKPDGSMQKTGKLPQPYQVEAPLACILPDAIEKNIKDLIEKREAEQRQSVQVSPDIGLFDRIGQLFGGGLRVIREILPLRYQFTNSVLQTLIEQVEAPVLQKKEAAERRTEELKQKQDQSLQQVENEELALEHAVNCFVSIQGQLNIHHPASELKVI